VPREACRGTFASNAQGRIYGFKTFGDYFTPRQLVALTTFADLVSEARERVERDAVVAGRVDDSVPLEDGGLGAAAYADAVATYLAFGLSKASSRNCTLAIWETGMDRLAGAFGRQGVSMTWDFAETNPLAGAGGDIAGTIESVCEVLDRLVVASPGTATQRDAASSRLSCGMIATDPPYYDNVGYADLSDFFYVWLRRTLRPVYPQLFGTLLTPKEEEMIASLYRHGGSRELARKFFEDHLAGAFDRIRSSQSPDYPLPIFYAFKQSEWEGGDTNGVTSTGWESMLEGLVRAGFQIDGTWPVRTELIGALKKDVGALASSIVLVCRPRSADAQDATRREFLAALRRELPPALKILRRENIAPVDLAQAAIGPGMAVYSRYREVQEPNGKRLPVRTALALINQTLDEALGGDYDADTRWAVTWYSQHGTGNGPFGDANSLANARATSVAGMEDAGIVRARGSIVRLLRPDELPPNWNPFTDERFTVWEVAHHLLRIFEASGGEEPVADLLAKALGRRTDVAELVHELAYQLFVIADRKGWATEARAYNSLIAAWPSISRLAVDRVGAQPQARLL
jgi:putative DNA methylase